MKQIMGNNQFTRESFQCEHCGQIVLMKIIAKGQNTIIDGEYCEEHDQYPEKIDISYQILECTSCKRINVIETTLPSCDFEIPINKYLYPVRKKLDASYFGMTELVKTYEEAEKCFKTSAFTASVIMCRKTIECLCLVHNVTRPNNLAGKIRKLRDLEIVSGIFYTWINKLKDFGNDATHEFKDFSRQDAQDILDFTYAVVEYCTDTRYKFDSLVSRREGVNNAKNHADIAILNES